MAALNIKLNRHLNNKSVWVIHLIIWASIFMLPFIFKPENEALRNRDEIDFRNLNAATNILWMGFFYLNALVLIPRFLYKKKFVVYVGSLIVSYCIIMLLHGALFIPFIHRHHFNFLISAQHNSIAFLFTIMVSITYKIIYDKFRADANAAILRQENLKTELAFLRSQVSPHFLFNVLNNIVAMVRLKSEELEPTVMRLSSLLQYMLYEGDEEKVLLKNEVESLQDYIELQKLRVNPNLNLQVHFNVKEEWHSIEPMLLIPFVENAFKHGNGLPENSEIVINLNVENNELDFNVKNRFAANDKAKDKTSGIGLVNVRRRLDLLYPKTHRLQIEDSNGWYKVDLKLSLK
jgi:two-component system, LytTR family, sensor kinase